MADRLYYELKRGVHMYFVSLVYQYLYLSTTRPISLDLYGQCIKRGFCTDENVKVPGQDSNPVFSNSRRVL